MPRRILTRSVAGLAVSLLLAFGLPATVAHVPLVGPALAPEGASAGAQAYVDCYTYAIRGIFGGQKGVYLYRICYNTNTCQWQTMSWTFVPDIQPLSVQPV